MAPYFWKMGARAQAKERKRSLSRGVNARSQNLSLDERFDHSLDGGLVPSKRRFMEGNNGRNSRNVSLRINENEEGSRNYPILVDSSEESSEYGLEEVSESEDAPESEEALEPEEALGSEEAPESEEDPESEDAPESEEAPESEDAPGSEEAPESEEDQESEEAPESEENPESEEDPESEYGSDISGDIMTSNEVNNGRNNTRNVRLRPSSPSRPSFTMNNGSTGNAFKTSNNMGDSNSIPRMSQAMRLKALMEIHINRLRLARRPVAQRTPPPSAQSVGIPRGHWSRSAYQSNVAVNNQRSIIFAEAARRVSMELSARRQSAQQLTQLSRTGNLPVSRGSGISPTAANVSVPALYSESNAGPPVGHTWGNGHTFSSGQNPAEVTRSSVIGAGRVIHPWTINNQPQSLSSAESADPWPLPVSGVNGQGRNHPNAYNSQHLLMASVGPSRETVSVSRINDRGPEHAITSNRQVLPAQLATLSGWPIPVSASNPQVSLPVNNTNQATIENTWPMPSSEDTWPLPNSEDTWPLPNPEDTWPMPMPAAASSQQNRQRGGVTRPREGERLDIGRSLQIPVAAGQNHSISEFESAFENAFEIMRRSLPGLVEGMMVPNNSSGVELPAEDAEDALDDMRLNIDDMSYEELLALGEQIGEVSTGLTEKDAKKRMRTRKFVPRKKGTEPCCICQEDYKEGDRLGTLKNCGHTFHPDCIMQWLMVKDMCPICKTETGSSS